MVERVVENRFTRRTRARHSRLVDGASHATAADDILMDWTERRIGRLQQRLMVLLVGRHCRSTHDTDGSTHKCHGFIDSRRQSHW